MQQNPAQKAKAGTQEDLFYLHLVENLVEDAEERGMSNGGAVMDEVDGLSGEGEASGSIEVCCHASHACTLQSFHSKSSHYHSLMIE